MSHELPTAGRNGVVLDDVIDDIVTREPANEQDEQAGCREADRAIIRRVVRRRPRASQIAIANSASGTSQGNSARLLRERGHGPARS